MSTTVGFFSGCCVSLLFCCMSVLLLSYCTLFGLFAAVFLLKRCLMCSLILRSLLSDVVADMLQNLLRALELDGLWDALSSCLTVVSVLEVSGPLNPLFLFDCTFCRVFLEIPVAVATGQFSIYILFCFFVFLAHLSGVSTLRRRYL